MPPKVEGKPTPENKPVESSKETAKTEPKRESTPVQQADVEVEIKTDYQRLSPPALRLLEALDHMQAPLVIRLPGGGWIVPDYRRFAGRGGEDGRSEPPERGERGERKETQKGRTGDAAERRGVRRGGALESQVAEAMHELAKSAPVSEAEVAIRQAKFGEKEKLLSAFEKTLVARFEGGEEQAPESTDGTFHFLKKTASEWSGFFEKFLHRSLQKIMNWSDVQGFLFRGLLQEKGMPQKGVLISDVMTAVGVDKFARIAVTLGKAQQLIAAQPGAVLTRDMVQAAVGEQLRYVALAAPTADEGGVQFSRAASRGLFSSQQLESRVAEDLGFVADFRGAGMPMRAADEKRAAGRRRRSLWSRWFGEDEIDGEGSVFVPWWRWDREERSGFRRWFVAVFGAVIFVALFFLIIALVRALR